MKRRNKRQPGYHLPVQLKYAVGLSLVAGLVNLVMIFMVAWFIERNYNIFMGEELGISQHVISIVKREQALLENALFLIFIGSISVMFAASLYVTRKLSGPMIALERYLVNRRGAAAHRKFKLRKNDEFQSIQKVVNDLVAEQEHLPT